MEFKIEEMQPADLKGACLLLNSVWGYDLDVLLDKAKWTFSSRHTKSLVIKNSEKEIIALRGAMLWPLSFDGNTIRSFQFNDTCVDVRYQRKGLFSMLNRRFVELAEKSETELIFNVSVDISRAGYEKLGWKYIPGFQTLFNFRNVLSFLKFYYYRSKKAEIVYPSKENDNISNELFLIREKHFNGLLHTGWNSSSLMYKINTSPRQGYHIHSYKKSAVIYKKYKQGKFEYLLIGDFFLKENTYSCFKQLYNSLLQREHPDMIKTSIFKTHPYYIFLKKEKFKIAPNRSNLNFGVRNLSTSVRKVDYTKAKWGLSLLDIDTF